MSEHDQPVAPNILNRQFEAERPNQRWADDTTELLIGNSGSKVYLAAIVDLFARFVVGWALKCSTTSSGGTRPSAMFHPQRPSAGTESDWHCRRQRDLHMPL